MTFKLEAAIGDFNPQWLTRESPQRHRPVLIAQRREAIVQGTLALVAPTGQRYGMRLCRCLIEQGRRIASCWASRDMGAANRQCRRNAAR